MEDFPDGQARVPPLPDETTRAQKLDAVARLAPGIAHELNNPLAAIGGFAELLSSDPRLPDDLRRPAELLVGEAATTRTIVETLLDFLRARPPERYPTSMAALVGAALTLHRYRLASGGIDVAVEIAPDVPMVAVDRAAIELVIVNLVQDAVDAFFASGGPGTLAVRASPDGERVRVSIEHDRSTEWEGAVAAHRDLAWRVSSAIVAAHGGALVRERAVNGAVTVVSFSLPVAVARDDTEPKDASRPGAQATSAVRVLVLDDQRPIGMLLERWLRAAGYEPTIATTGQEGIELVREIPFDAVLCDHRLADVAGTAVFDRIVAIRPQLERRFVFMSGDAMNPELQKFVTRHRVVLLAKPFDLEAVLRALEAVLRDHDVTARYQPG